MTEATICSRHQELGPLENLKSSQFGGEQQWKIQPSNGKMKPDWRPIFPIEKNGGGIFRCNRFVCFFKTGRL